MEIKLALDGIAHQSMRTVCQRRRFAHSRRGYEATEEDLLSGCVYAEFNVGVVGIEDEYGYVCWRSSD